MPSRYEGSSARSLLLMLAALVSRDQGAIIDYLREENRVLRELIGDKRLPLTDAAAAPAIRAARPC